MLFIEIEIENTPLLKMYIWLKASYFGKIIDSFGIL